MTTRTDEKVSIARNLSNIKVLDDTADFVVTDVALLTLIQSALGWGELAH